MVFKFFKKFYQYNFKNGLILDAGALNFLSLLDKNSFVNHSKLILTPHPGEAATLLNTNVETIESDRFAYSAKIQKKFNATVVLKGSGTVICHKKNGIQQWGVCNAGNPGMASGGMGDVLTGIIAGMLAQGLTPKEACEVGVDLHAKAADQASFDLGEVGLTPSDVIEELRYLLKYD